jgi:hypothetical protein
MKGWPGDRGRSVVGTHRPFSTPPRRPSAVRIHLPVRFLRFTTMVDNCERAPFQRATNALSALRKFHLSLIIQTSLKRATTWAYSCAAPPQGGAALDSIAPPRPNESHSFVNESPRNAQTSAECPISALEDYKMGTRDRSSRYPGVRSPCANTESTLAIRQALLRVEKSFPRASDTRRLAQPI